MKFEFPYQNFPINVPGQIIKRKDRFNGHVVINGKKYRISRKQDELRIAYRVNNILDVFL